MGPSHEESVVYDRGPLDPRGSEHSSNMKGGAHVLDLTSRLPEGRRGATPEPSGDSSLFVHRVIILLAFVLGLGVGIWVKDNPAPSMGARGAQRLVKSLSALESLVVAWPEQAYRPLRLMPLSEEVQPGVVKPLSLKEERAGELYLLERAQDARDARALRALGMIHILRSPDDAFSRALADDVIKERGRLYGTSVSVLNDMAVLAALDNRVPESLDHLQDALQKDSDEPILYFNAAQVSRALYPEGSSQEESYLLRYLSLDTGSPWRTALQKRLDTLVSDRLGQD